jgi:hypothetical protein
LIIKNDCWALLRPLGRTSQNILLSGPGKAWAARNFSESCILHAGIFLTTPV